MSTQDHWMVPFCTSTKIKTEQDSLQKKKSKKSPARLNTYFPFCCTSTPSLCSQASPDQNSGLDIWLRLGLLRLRSCVISAGRWVGSQFHPKSVSNFKPSQIKPTWGESCCAPAKRLHCTFLGLETLDVMLETKDEKEMRPKMIW